MLACPQRIWRRRWRLLVATLGRALEDRAMQRRTIMRAELSVVASCDGKLSRRAALLSVYLILIKSSWFVCVCSPHLIGALGLACPLPAIFSCMYLQMMSSHIGFIVAISKIRL